MSIINCKPEDAPGGPTVRTWSMPPEPDESVKGVRVDGQESLFTVCGSHWWSATTGLATWEDLLNWGTVRDATDELRKGEK